MATSIERERNKEKAVHDKLDQIIKLLKEVVSERTKSQGTKKTSKVQSK
jgi:hypothetical protein